MAEVSRRSIVAALGLAPAAAIGTDSFASVPPQDGIPSSQDLKTETVSGALRKLAAMIDSGSVLVSGIDIHSTAMAGDIMKHVLSMQFVYR